MKKGWQTKTLGEVLEKTESVNPLRSPNAEFDYIDVSSVSNTTFEIEETQRLKGKDAPSRARKLVRTNDIIFATIRPTLQRIAVVPEHLDKQVCSTGYFVLRPKQGIDHRFVFYSLFTEDFIRQMESLQKGASYPAVTDGDVRAQAIPVPPLAEQQRIVGLLDKAFEGLATAKANAEKNLHNARALIESRLQSVFTERGPGWVEKTLGDICVVDWGNTDLTKSSYVEGGKFLAVSAAGCDGRIGHKEHAKHTPVLSAIGAQCGRMFLPEEDFTAIKNTITLTPRDDTCAGKFLYRLLTHVELPKRGAAQPFIAKGDILKFQIVVPEDSEAQLRIVDSLAALEEETHSLARLYERKHAALEALKKSLLHQAFTGEL